MNADVSRFIVGQSSRCRPVVTWEREAPRAAGNADNIRSDQVKERGSAAVVLLCGTRWAPAQTQAMNEGNHTNKSGWFHVSTFPHIPLSHCIPSCCLFDRLSCFFLTFMNLVVSFSFLRWKPVSLRFWQTPLVKLVLPHHDLFYSSHLPGKVCHSSSSFLLCSFSAVHEMCLYFQSNAKLSAPGPGWKG